MLAARGYKTKKELKASVGKPFHYEETSVFGEEFKPNGLNVVVGPSPYKRKWYARVWCNDGIITKVE